jgi:lipopolysaccharide export system protein LptA
MSHVSNCPPKEHQRQLKRSIISPTLTALCVLFLLACLPHALVASLPFELEADHIEMKNNEQELHASGNVIINYKTYIIESENAIFIKQKNNLFFSKNVRISDMNQNTLLANAIQLNIESDIGTISGATIQTNRNFIIKAKKINLKKDAILLEQCTLTSCTSTEPEWHVQSSTIAIDKVTGLINSKDNILYFYNIPIFLVPDYSQNMSQEDATNQPTPELGYNQIDSVYGNIYLGYVVSKNTLGKVGIGLSQNRGFRYGATHVYAPNSNESVTLKTYHINQTGFEGGVIYNWKHSENVSDARILDSITNQPTKETFTAEFQAQYTFDNIYYNELVHAIPELKLTLFHPSFYLNSSLDTMLSIGHFQDRHHKGNRQKIHLASNKILKEFGQNSFLKNQLNLNGSYYSPNKHHWNRIYNSLTLSHQWSILQSQTTLTKLLYQHGKSPFIFDTINEVSDDEIGLTSSINLNPLVLIFQLDYQMNLKSFRNISYALEWHFQCWTFGVGVNTVWNEIFIGVSIPDF